MAIEDGEFEVDLIKEFPFYSIGAIVDKLDFPDLSSSFVFTRFFGSRLLAEDLFDYYSTDGLHGNGFTCVFLTSVNSNTEMELLKTFPRETLLKLEAGDRLSQSQWLLISNHIRHHNSFRLDNSLHKGGLCNSRHLPNLYKIKPRGLLA